MCCVEERNAWSRCCAVMWAEPPALSIRVCSATAGRVSGCNDVILMRSYCLYSGSVCARLQRMVASVFGLQ